METWHARASRTSGEVQFLGVSPSPLNIESVLSTAVTLTPEQESQVKLRRYSTGTPDSRHLVSAFDLAPRYVVAPSVFRLGNQLGLLASEGKVAQGARWVISDVVGAGVTLQSATVSSFGSGVYLTEVHFRTRIDHLPLDNLLAVLSALRRSLSPGGILRTVSDRVIDLGFGYRSREVDFVERTAASIHASTSHSATDMAQFLHRRARELIAVHISGDPAISSDPRLTSAVLRATADLNMKAESQLLLLNSQGVMHLESETDPHHQALYRNRFSRAVSLLGVALVFQQTLLDLAGHRREDDRWSPKTALHKWIRYPMNVFNTSVSNRVMWEAASNSFHLQHLLDEIESER